MLEGSPSRRVAVAGVVGALCVVLSLAVAPFAFGPLQFRLGEVLKPLVIKYPETIPAFAVGVGIVNLYSPLAGALEQRAAIIELVQRYVFMENCVVVGRGLAYANAYELALKLMETCYVVAERFSSADFLHGPLAMVERRSAERKPAARETRPVACRSAGRCWSR